MEHRTYLWLHLATDDIYYTFRTSLRRNQQSIKFILSTVEHAYEKVLGRVDKKDKLNGQTDLADCSRSTTAIDLEVPVVAGCNAKCYLVICHRYLDEHDYAGAYAVTDRR